MTTRVTYRMDADEKLLLNRLFSSIVVVYDSYGAASVGDSDEVKVTECLSSVDHAQSKDFF